MKRRTAVVVMPGARMRAGAAVDLQGHGLGLAHQGEFGGGLDHPAAVDDRRAVDEGHVSRGLR
jgi:hypothetical protein